MQELKELVKIFKRYRYLLILPVVLGGGGALIFSLLTPILYEASASLYIYRSEESGKENFYTYEGYYSQQASKEYTDVVIGLLKTPDLARLALEKTGLENSNPNFLLGSLKVKKLAPQLISIAVAKEDSNQAKNLLVSLAQAAAERTQSLNKETGRGVVVSLVKEEPLITKKPPPSLLNVSIGVVGGLIVAASLIFTITYLKRP